MSNRTTIHLIVSLTLLVSLFVVLPGVFLYRFGRQVLTTLPEHNKRTVSFRALKQFRQKHRLLENDYLIDTVSYTQEELSAGYFEDFYKKGNKSILDPELKIHPSVITISATLYLFSLPVTWPFNTILAERFPIEGDSIALYTRITVENHVFIKNERPTLTPKRIFLGEKEVSTGLLFLVKKVLPNIFTKGMSYPVGKIILKEGEMVVYKASSSE